jgi:dTDP-4-dehydrorhamnose reductase
MRVLVLGGAGMLGHKLCQVLGERFETWTTVRGDARAFGRYELLPTDRVVGGVDASDLDSVVRAFGAVRPDVVVNAIGIVKQLPVAKDPVVSLTVNSLFPHRVAQLCAATGARLIHLSTDCVFTGSRGGYAESDPPDAEDLYGRSKLLGEVSGPRCLTLRTSIIGRELSTRHGLLEWFLSNRGGKVKGYRGAIFSGFPTVVLAGVIADVIEHHPDLTGLYHVSAAPIDKDALLRLFDTAYGASTAIEPVDEPREDRSLDSSRFRQATGYHPPDWLELVRQMAADPAPYDRWRS